MFYVKKIVASLLVTSVLTCITSVACAETRLSIQDATNTDKMVITDTGAIGSGTNNPIGQLDVVKEWPNKATTNYISVFTSYGDASRLTVRSSGGTIVAPLNTKANDPLGNINFRGHDGASFSSTGNATVSAHAEGDFSSTSQPTRLLLTTTPIGSTTALERLRIAADGRLRLSNQPVAPANNATCTVGDIILDAPNGFLYVCTATNSWKRVGLSAY